MPRLVLPFALVAFALAGSESGCVCVLGTPDADNDDPPISAGDAPSPLRRLTAEELNRTLRDLFPRASLPVIAISEDRGKDFAQEVHRQAVSDSYVEQLRAGAFAVGEALAAQPNTFLVRAPQNAADERAVIDETLQVLLPRAFRRPLNDGELATYLAFHDARQAAGDPLSVRLQLLAQAIVQSPHLIYRLELEGDLNDADEDGRVAVSSVEMASRLSYFLWGTMPDDALLQAGIDGALSTSQGIEAQVDRLIDDPRFLDAMGSFHRQWLDFDRILRTNKSADRFPQYNDTVRQAMRQEAFDFIATVVAEDPTLRALLTSRRTRISPALNVVYGTNVNADSLVTLPDDRSGILTQASFLASHGHATEGSPVLRGVFVLERLICAAPPVPDPSIDLTPPSEVDDNGGPQTNRQRYTRHTTDPTCQSCHGSIDGVGFGLEAYDSLGQHRTTDNGFPVDDSGTLNATAVGGDYRGARELGERLADSDVVRECVARHWFRFANGRRDVAADDDAILQATAAYAADDTAIPTLLRAIVNTQAFRTRKVQQ